MPHTIEQRRQQHAHLSAHLARLDDQRLQALLDAYAMRPGWGKSHTIDVDGAKVFVKRLPVTSLEYANLFSTSNLYDLPTYYHYGVGSAGFGVFRELAAHIKTTAWVLNGAIANFPLLYHERIVPFAGERTGMSEERRERYVRYWGGNHNIGQYMLDRASAPYELLLFLEYVPNVLSKWLQAHPEQIADVLDDLRAAVDFLRANNVLHFDAHFNNILTDGQHTYLTDFGLVIDKAFALDDAEQAFFAAHTLYDYGEVLAGLDSLIYDWCHALPEDALHQLYERYGIPTSESDHALMVALIDHIDELQASGELLIPDIYRACIAKYRDITILMHTFYADMRRTNQKDTPFPRAELHRLLLATGFVGAEMRNA